MGRQIRKQKRHNDVTILCSLLQLHLVWLQGQTSVAQQKSAAKVCHKSCGQTCTQTSKHVVHVLNRNSDRHTSSFVQ